MSPNKHQLKGSDGKYVSGSAKARKLEEGIILEMKLKVGKVESDDGASDFESCVKCDGKPFHVDIDREVTVSSQKEPTLALLLNRSEEKEINSNT